MFRTSTSAGFNFEKFIKVDDSHTEEKSTENTVARSTSGGEDPRTADSLSLYIRGDKKGLATRDATYYM